MLQLRDKSSKVTYEAWLVPKQYFDIGDEILKLAKDRNWIVLPTNHIHMGYVSEHALISKVAHPGDFIIRKSADFYDIVKEDAMALYYEVLQ